MQIFLFSRDGIGGRIHDAVMRAEPKTEVFSAMGELANRLRHPSGEPVMAVLIAGSRKDLAELRQMKWLLHDCRIVLILPDRDVETVAAGHSFQPRFLGCLEDDEEEIAAVLCKMLIRQMPEEDPPSRELPWNRIS